MNICCLTRYDDLGASSRLRFGQYIRPLAALIPGLQVNRQSLLDAGYLRRKYAQLSTAGSAAAGYLRRLGHLLRGPRPDLWWVEKELAPWLPASVERALLAGAPYVLDLDDAIFHNYDRHRLAVVRRLWGRKIDRLMAGAALVVAGNRYLAARAEAAGAKWVEILPTVIDLARYPVPAPRAAAAPGAPITLVWIGSPASVHYLRLLAEPLAALAARTALRLRVIGARIELPAGIECEFVPWSEASEVAAITACDIGLMPLPDSPWERGKCGYKLIQYLACGLPVVASPVGVNAEIVQPGANGFLAEDAAQWQQHIGALAGDAIQRAALGAAGRRLVEQRYSLQVTAPRLAALLQQAVG